MASAHEAARPTLDQRRARHAWDAVRRLQRDHAKGAGEYAREAKRLPMRIRTSGLGQALAFVCAKAGQKKPNLQQLHRDLTDWTIGERPMKAKQPGSLLQSVIQGDSDFLRRATDETIAYLQWLNRFAEAEGLTDDRVGD